MVSHDLPRLTVTNQIAFDQRDLYSTPEFERTMDRRLAGAGFQIGNLRYQHFYLTDIRPSKLKSIPKSHVHFEFPPQ